MRSTSCLLLCMAGCLVARPVAADDGRPVEVSSVLVKLIEEVEVPAREAGVLDEIAVREGAMVEEGALIAQIDDAAPRFDRRKAELELDGARKLAGSDVKVRFARKSAEVADAELQRALRSEERLAESVSASELDQLRLQAEKAVLEIEQAQLEQTLAQASCALKENDVAASQHSIDQRRITSPLAGFVAQVLRDQGEWVEPGQPIARILRLDRLRAEGLVNAQDVSGEMKGRPVKLTLQSGDQRHEYEGQIVFVSPEVDPVNGQVRVWAEIDNSDLNLRPGLHGSMIISAASQEP